MATNYSKRKKNLLALFLSLMMASSAVGLAACNEEKEESSSPDTSTTQTDDARIKNGSFEFTSDDKTELIVTSPTGWSIAKQTSADTSKTASGIIDTSVTAWDNLTKTSLKVDAPKTKESAEALWDEMSAYDKLQFYKAWDDADNDEDYDEFDFYDAETDSFNIDADDPQ